MLARVGCGASGEEAALLDAAGGVWRRAKFRGFAAAGCFSGAAGWDLLFFVPLLTGGACGSPRFCIELTLVLEPAWF